MGTLFNAGFSVNSFKKGLLLSVPIVLGYIPVAVAFGVSAVSVGLSRFETFLSSLLVYAGASQFAMISLIGVSHISAVIIPVLLNLRHLIYGSIISHRYNVRMPFVTAFGLTDEVFAVSSSILESESFLWGLELGAYLSWLFGTSIGIFGGEFLMSSFSLSDSLSFSLTVLFFILLLPAFRDGRKLSIVGGGLVALLFHYIGYTFLGILTAGLVIPLLTVKYRR